MPPTPNPSFSKLSAVVPPTEVTWDDDVMIIDDLDDPVSSQSEAASTARTVAASSVKVPFVGKSDGDAADKRVTRSKSGSDKVKNSHEGTAKGARGITKVQANTAKEEGASMDVPSDPPMEASSSTAVKMRAKSKGPPPPKKPKSVSTKNSHSTQGNPAPSPATSNAWTAAANMFGMNSGGPPGSFGVPSASNPFLVQPGMAGYQLVESSTPNSSGGLSYDPFSIMTQGLTQGIASMGGFSHMGSSWDPLHARDWDGSQPLPICHKRMKHDLEAALKDEAETGIYLVPIEDDITKLNALVIGPKGTPYEGGFFMFYVRVAPNYPMVPPRVRNLTNGNGQVRFGPNFYADGKVCLSILGTWSGPSWTAALNLQTMLQSIQSLMSVAALTNEPGFEKLKPSDPQVVSYDRFVRHETIRVAVIASLEAALNPPRPESQMPAKFRKAMYSYFEQNFSDLTTACDNNASFDNKSMTTTMVRPGGTYQWSSLRKRLMDLKASVLAAIGQL